MIEIFRAGDHKGKTYTEEQVREIAESYDRTRHEAPFLVNHDETKPNQGLVKAVIALGGRLFAIPHKVVSEFAESVNSGRTPKISVRLYHPDDPANPVPTKWGLRHVAAVQVPAVKGMEDPTFAEDSTEFCFSEPSDAKFGVKPKDLDFMDWDDMTNARLWANLREFFIGKFGIETANQVIPAELVDELKISAAMPEPEMVMPMLPMLPMDYSEKDKKEGEEMTLEFAERETALTQREADHAKREADFAKREANLKELEFAEYCDRLIGEGKVFGHEKQRIVSTLVQLSGNSESLEFAEGEETKSTSLIDSYKKDLEARTKQIEFAELPDESAPSDTKQRSKKISDRVKQEKAKGNIISYVEAQALTEAGK